MNLLNFKTISSPILALALVASAGAAQAATTIVSGSGTVNLTAQSSNATIAAAGAPVSFSAQFDPASATFVGTFGASSVYNLNTNSIAAMIGGHSLNFDPAGLESAFLIIANGFSNFGGPVSEAILIEEFQFFAGPGGTTSPVRLNGLPPAREIMGFSYTFRTGTTIVPATIETLRDPAEAARGSFFYLADTGTSGSPAARASGLATGAFEVVSPVPEPATWALMIAGFFMTGTALRKRRGNPSTA
jgi:hypothetical protein